MVELAPVLLELHPAPGAVAVVLRAGKAARSVRGGGKIERGVFKDFYGVFKVEYRAFLTLLVRTVEIDSDGIIARIVGNDVPAVLEIAFLAAHQDGTLISEHSLDSRAAVLPGILGAFVQIDSPQVERHHVDRPAAGNAFRVLIPAGVVVVHLLMAAGEADRHKDQTQNYFDIVFHIHSPFITIRGSVSRCSPYPCIRG